MAIVTEPLNGSFGRSVRGLDLSRELDEDVIREVLDLLYRHHVLVIRSQALTKAQYERFARNFGKLRDFSSLFRGKEFDPEFPEMTVLSNSPDVPETSRDSAAFWHSDGSYDFVPDSTTMLYALEAPNEGGETVYVDLEAAYEALPNELKCRIDDLQVWHHVNSAERWESEVSVPADTDASPYSLSAAMKDVTPLHPLVRTHPVTGRKSLYAVSGTPVGIKDMPRAESARLLRFLKEHALQPWFCTIAKAEAGDLLMWDNGPTMHTATPLEYSREEGKRRYLLRLCLNGLPPCLAGDEGDAEIERVG